MTFRKAGFKMVTVGNKSILIVDDEVDLCDLLADFFEDAGFKVQKAYSGNQAISILEKSIFDVVLTDIKMPNGTGIDLLKHIKGINGQNITVIMTTGFADISESEVVSMGAKCILRKPLELETLLNRVLALL